MTASGEVLSTASVFTCSYCKFHHEGQLVHLKVCPACLEVPYCSEECREAGRQSHEGDCSPYEEVRPWPPATQVGPDSDYYTQYPFRALEHGTWLKRRSEKEIYACLVDTYRMRVYDQARDDDGNIDPETDILFGQSRSQVLENFNLFLARIWELEIGRDNEARLLPQWLHDNDHYRRSLLCFAETDRFSCIHDSVNEEEIKSHYGDPTMPLQLKVFGEQLDGYRAHGMSGAVTKQMKSYHRQRNRPVWGL